MLFYQKWSVSNRRYFKSQITRIIDVLQNYKSGMLIFIIILLTGVGQCLFAQKATLPSMGICAHRGAMDTHPENTITAFEEAVHVGVQMIELDVRMTKDKKLVILHDETVDRTTDGSGRIEDLTLKQVKKLDAGSWKSSRFEAMRIPTLDEVLAIMPRDIWINVHLKGGKVLGKKVAKKIVKAKREHQAFLACGLEAANAARLVSPDILICNMERQERTEDYISMTVQNRSEFIQLYKVPVTPEVQEYTRMLKEHDIKVNYCCTDSPDEVRQLLEFGVDFVLVNKPGMIMETIQMPDR